MANSTSIPLLSSIHRKHAPIANTPQKYSPTAFYTKKRSYSQYTPKVLPYCLLYEETQL